MVMYHPLEGSCMVTYHPVEGSCTVLITLQRVAVWSCMAKKMFSPESMKKLQDLTVAVWSCITLVEGSCMVMYHPVEGS